MGKKQKQADENREIVGGGETGPGLLSGNGGGEAKPAETKAERFTRLAQRRMTDALKRISRVGNLSNPAQYTYTPEQTEKMVSALFDAVNAVGAKFNGQKEKASGFTF